MSAAGRSPLTLLQPMPPAVRLPQAYRRHAPSVEEQRAVLRDLVKGCDWATMSWSELIEALLGLGRTDIPLARLAEGHVDAVRILAQGGAKPGVDVLYGVWASRSQHTGVRAEPLDGGRVRLDGTLRFASGAGLLDRALVPVWMADGSHLLLDLEVDALPVDETAWRTSAMAPSRTHVVAFDGVVVDDARVGDVDFYLQRPGFFPGGVGVAACWVGGAARLLDLIHQRHAQPSPAQQPRLGRMRTELVAGAAVVRAAADVLDRLLPGSVPVSGQDPALRQAQGPSEADWHGLATEARAAAAESVRRMLAESRSVTGPAGMALDEDLGHAVPDLELYVLQQNSDADAASLGDPSRWP